MTAWRRVFHRYWWSLGWSSNPNRREDPHITWNFCPSNFNRPIVRWDREVYEGERHGFIVFEWGNGNSDPAWSIGAEW